MRSEKPTVLILYHYFHPDDVVSAQHYSGLAEDLCARGWRVIVMPCNRGCRRETDQFTSCENWRGIDIRRVWRPRFRQASTIGRLLNAMWMIAAWSLAALRKRSLPGIDVLIVGTDPIFGVVVARAWKMFRRTTKIVHWCFDLYPEAAIAGDLLRTDGKFVKTLCAILRKAYNACDVIVDIGECMRKRLDKYNPRAARETMTPWALEEIDRPVQTDQAERQALFGNAKLAILYSGTFGRGHSYELFLQLARRLRDRDICFVFSVRGNRAEMLREAVTEEDTNIRFAPFAEQGRLLARLGSADIHLTSLRDEFTGTMVPSKFFGSLAVGRPVIFQGSPESAIAEWISEHGVGWLLEEDSLDTIAAELSSLANSSEGIDALRNRCHEVYQGFFSRTHVMDNFDRCLRRLMNENSKEPK